MKRFSREQYKMNFVELQVPSGHQNPLRYKPKIYETSMTQEQAHLLHNISREQTREQQPCDILRQNEIDCGLISILLAICYDVRTTNNEATCESGWTRSILCPLYCYFEQFDNYRDVLVAFLRRMITYPMYRNFELGRQCVRDAIEVLKGGRNWLINQLLLTHQQFSSGEPSRDSFNTYYLEDYIRYVTSPSACSDEHMRLLARNLKNVLMDVNKQHLGLGVTEIETELIKELMQEEGSGGERGGGGGTGDAPKPKSGRKDYIATFLHLPTLANATSAHLPDKEPLVQEWKLKRITDQCQLQLDGHERTYKLTNHFGYGYASKYSGPLDTSEVSIPFRVAPFP